MWLVILHRMILSLTTPRRFSPAHKETHHEQAIYQKIHRRCLSHRRLELRRRNPARVVGQSDDWFEPQRSLTDGASIDGGADDHLGGTIANKQVVRWTQTQSDDR
jgi:hypothetical protein